jgi:chitinase
MKNPEPFSVKQAAILLLGGVLLPGLASAQTTPSVMAYYVGWEQSQMAPSAIDFTAITALIHFAVVPNSNGTLNAAANGLTAANISAAVAAAHGAGKKILFTVGGEGTQAAFEGAMSGANQAAFISNLVSFMTTNKYDGIDIDMEPTSAGDQTLFVQFAAKLRTALNAVSPRPMLTTTAAETPALFAAAAPSFDQINIMTYSLSGPYGGWFTWHNAPVYSTGYEFPNAGGAPPSADTMVQQFAAAGISKSVLGIGFTMDPYVWSGVSAPGQTWPASSPPTATESAYNTIAAAYGIVEYNYTLPTYHWDANAQAPYLSITNQTPNLFVSYDNEVSAASKAQYIKTNGLGSLIIWDLQDGHRADQPAGSQDVLLEAIKTAVFGTAGSGGTVTTPPPVIASGCVTSSSSVWQNVALAAQTGFFTVGFTATPGLANEDGVVGLSAGAAAAYTSQAAAVRFNNTGTIDARNAGAYAASASVPYVAGLSYLFSLVVNIPARTYSAYVTQGANAKQTIGLNYAFRTEQSSATTLSDLGLFADVGSVTACNPAVTVSGPPTVISAVSTTGVGPAAATIVWTTNNPADTQVQYGPTTAYGETSTLVATPVTSHSVALGGLTAATVYHYHVMSRDAGGSLITSPDATFTTSAAAVAPPPVISAVSAAGIGATSATIEWTTNEAANGQVAYGLTSSYGSLTTLNTAATTSHSAALSGLTAGTVYHYSVGSQAASGPVGTSPDATFTTSGAVVVTPPVTTPAGCVASAASAWQNVPLTSETGTFTASFDATPSIANEDGVSGLSDGAASAFTSQAAIVRFNDTGTIDARNAGVYAAASSIPYTAGKSYHFQLVVNMKAHTYSAYVTPASGAQQTIGLNYAFRTEQKAVTLLNNLGVVDDTIGSVTVCNVVP